MSKPLSLVEALKFSYQAYKGGEKKYYILPSSSELKKLSEYTNTIKGNESKLQQFMDTNKQITRISYQIADIGSMDMKKFVKEAANLKPDADFESTKTGERLLNHIYKTFKGLHRVL